MEHQCSIIGQAGSPGPGTQVISSHPEEALAKLKQQAGKDIVIPGSSTLTASLLQTGLLDELEMYAKMQDAFVRAGEQGGVTPIHMFYREWAVIVEIERQPEIARRLHAAEQALMSEDPRVRDAAINDAGEIVRAAHRAVAGVPVSEVRGDAQDVSLTAASRRRIR